MMKLRNEFDQMSPKLDPEKRYSFTWPGQPPKVVSGAELAAICKGADASMLAIEEAKDAPPSAPLPLFVAPEEKVREKLGKP